MFFFPKRRYQRGYRTRELRKLKSFTFRRRAPVPRPSPLETQVNSTGAAEVSGGGGSSSAGGTTAATIGRTESSSATTAAAALPPPGLAPENDPSVSSAPTDQGRATPGDSSRPGHPSACGEEGGENRCGGGAAGEGRGAQDGAAGIGNGNSSSSSSSGNGNGNGASEEDNREFMRGAEDDVCAICLETYEEGDSLTGLPCRHSFHTHCIGPWLSGKSVLCPMCKTEAFGKGGVFRTTGPMLEAAFAELASLCTENLAVLGLFFLASVACGVIAAKLSLRG